MFIPLSLYIHFPWCIRKCPYCDFNSHTLQTDLPEQQYINVLLNDLEQALPAIEGRPIQTIFMGGGTPSLFSANALDQLLTGIRSSVHCQPNLEITLEANPGTFEQQRFKDYRAIGINRLSIGIQSFQENKLKVLGRIHNAIEACRAAEIAYQAGFVNFNLDLMFGLPQQTLADALYDLQTAILLKPTHLSWYQLTLEPNTYFYRFPPSLPQDDLLWEMQQAGQALLAENKYLQYEVSAYAKPQRQCQHNMNYWQFGDYLGIGAGAHSKITQFHNKAVTRFMKNKNPKDYISSQKSIEKKIITTAELPLEFMMNAMRLNQPVSKQLFNERTGLSATQLQPQIQQGKMLGLLDDNKMYIHLTPLGKKFLNNTLQLFLPTNTHV